MPTTLHIWTPVPLGLCTLLNPILDTGLPSRARDFTFEFSYTDSLFYGQSTYGLYHT